MQVLYVDADPESAASVAAALEREREGLSVVTETGADAALERVVRERVDCVVSDYPLGETDGLALLEAVGETDPDLPFVLFTAEGSEAVASDAYATGATGYLRREGGEDQFGTLADLVADAVSRTGGDDRLATADGAVATTPRERAAAGERDRMFSTLVRNLPGMVYRCRNERGWPMSFVSPGCAELTGYDAAELETDAVSWGEDVIHPDDREWVWTDVQDALDRGEPFRLTYRIVRKDGTERWVWEQGRGVYNKGELEALEGYVTDVTERVERERRFEAVFNRTFQFTGLLDPDGTILEANETALEFGDLDRDEVVGEKIWDSYWFQHGGAGAVAREAVERAAAGEFFRETVEVRGAEGPAVIDFSVRPVTDESGEVTLLVPEGRDITDLERREEQLEALNDLSRELTAADDRGEIPDVAVRAAEETLGLALSTIELYDEDTGELVPRAWTDDVEELVGDRSLFAPENDEAWQVFLDHDRTVYDDLGERSDVPTASTHLESAIVLPLGKHGVFTAGATTTDAFSEAEVDLAGVLAAHAEAALDRVDRERTLRERTETLERKNERLERTRRVNEVIRDLTGALVRASTREEIEAVVPERLADAGPYRFAWMGTRDPVTDEVRPAASAGVGDGYLDAVTATAADTDADGEGEPTGRAVRTREPQVVDDVRTDPPFEPWRKEALSRDYRSVVSVPVAYEDSLYGAFSLYTDEPDLFEGLEREVLAELGETIGYAINAAERKKALTSDRVVELRFRVRDPELDLFRCVERAGGRFELEGIVRRDDGAIRAFFTLEDGSPEVLADCAAEAPEIREFGHVSGDETESVFEVTLVGEGLVGTIVDHGAVPKAITAEGEQVTVVVELPEGRDVREFAEMFETRFADATLVARRERDRPIRTLQGFDEEFDELLTDRQREAVKTAYLSGFFEWPRESTGEEVAATLGVSQPTFNRHLRASQRKLFGLLFGDVGADLNV